MVRSALVPPVALTLGFFPPIAAVIWVRAVVVEVSLVDDREKPPVQVKTDIRTDN